MQQTSALKSNHDDDFDKLSDEEKKKVMEQGVKQEREAHEKYHGKVEDKKDQSIVQDESSLGKNIQAQLDKARKPGGATSLPKVKYEQLVNKLEKIYRAMYPDPDESNVRGTYGPWNPYEGK